MSLRASTDLCPFGGGSHKGVTYIRQERVAPLCRGGHGPRLDPLFLWRDDPAQYGSRPLPTYCGSFTTGKRIRPFRRRIADHLQQGRVAPLCQGGHCPILDPFGLRDDPAQCGLSPTYCGFLRLIYTTGKDRTLNRGWHCPILDPSHGVTTQLRAAYADVSRHIDRAQHAVGREGISAVVPARERRGLRT